MEGDQRQLANDSMAFAEEENIPPPRVEKVQAQCVATDEENYFSQCKVMGEEPLRPNKFGNNRYYF